MLIFYGRYFSFQSITRIYPADSNLAHCYCTSKVIIPCHNAGEKTDNNLSSPSFYKGSFAVSLFEHHVDKKNRVLTKPSCWKWDVFISFSVSFIWFHKWNDICLDNWFWTLKQFISFIFRVRYAPDSWLDMKKNVQVVGPIDMKIQSWKRLNWLVKMKTKANMPTNFSYFSLLNHQIKWSKLTSFGWTFRARLFSIDKSLMLHNLICWVYLSGHQHPTLQIFSIFFFNNLTRKLKIAPQGTWTWDQRN